MEKINDYADRAESLIPEQLKRVYGGPSRTPGGNEIKPLKGERSRFAKEIRAFADQVQDLENAAHIIYTTRSIDAGLQYGITQGWDIDKNPILDDIGDIVDQPRYNHNNADYAIFLKAKIMMNASRGEPERIIETIRSICGTEVIRYYEYYPASIVVEFESDAVPEGLNSIMQRIVSGGVRIGIVASSETDAFAFSDDGTLGSGDAVHGFAPVNQSSGGKLSALII